MLDPLDTLPAGTPERTLGWGVLAWALPRFRQPNGPNAGQPFRPTHRQVRFLLWWYSVDEQGEFIYRHAVRRLAKGSGKSPFAAFIALCEFCGPTRFDYFDDDVPGGAVGRPVGMPLIQIAACTEAQTKNTMRHVRAFAARGTRLAVEYSLDPGKLIYYRPPDGELQVLTSSVAAAEGAEPTALIADETEHWVPSIGGPEFYETLDRNLAKSNSRMIETCNAWVPGAGSVAEATWDAWLAQEEGKLRGTTRILYDAVEAPADTDLADEASLIEALKLVYADCPWVNIRAIAERIWSPTTRPEVARRFYLNQRVADDTAWTTPTKWAALADPTVVVGDGDEIVAFFDGSRTDDATALVGCRVSDGHVFEIGVWEPGSGTIDASAVDRAVRLMFERWTVLAFFADVQEWQQYVLTEWPERYGADLLLWARPSGNPPEAIAWDMRAHKREFAQACEAANHEIETGGFTHDGSSVVARHVGNMQRRPYQQWISVGKVDRARKIDSGVCVIGARMVRRKLLGSTEWQNRESAANSGQFWSF
ncbi:hypothetical protein [Pseudonocardia alni]|uniref:hypothetical protein n=1 Tax=Pseudonocardia alni TaxID=33907 RepID=UPI003319A047